MSYAPNSTVLQHYSRGSIAPLPILIQYVRQLADTLQHAHAHELVHRDVKPKNILLGRDEGILLSDFGLTVLSTGFVSLDNNVSQIIQSSYIRNRWRQ